MRTVGGAATALDAEATTCTERPCVDEEVVGGLGVATVHLVDAVVMALHLTGEGLTDLVRCEEDIAARLLDLQEWQWEAITTGPMTDVILPPRPTGHTVAGRLMASPIQARTRLCPASTTMPMSRTIHLQRTFLERNHRPL